MQILFMRSFFSFCAFSMKATNSLEGFGILIAVVVAICLRVLLALDCVAQEVVDEGNEHYR